MNKFDSFEGYQVYEISELLEKTEDRRKGGKHTTVYHSVFSVRYFDSCDNQLPYYDSIYNDGHIISADDLFEARKIARDFGKKYIPDFYWCEVLAM